MRELIIDITYQCNSECYYCQWSSSNSSVNRKIPIKQLIVSQEKFKDLSISRIIINGGEPFLSKNLQPILTYYKGFNLPIRLISNGIELNEDKINLLINLGVSEFVISLDSVFYDTYSKNRSISQKLFEKIMDNLVSLSKIGKKLYNFLGLNVVLTSKNSNWNNISSLLDFVRDLHIKQIKFQPVFNDGYLTKKAPELALNKEDVPHLKEIEIKIKNLEFQKNFTNPVGFWSDLIAYLSGTKLNSRNCKVADNAILLHEGILKFCFWCKHINYGPISESFTKDDFKNKREEFTRGLNKCTVLPQCFCLQPINHEWITR